MQKTKKSKYYKLNTRLQAIQENEIVSAAGNVNMIVVLSTDDGNFSNYKTIWNDQEIDADKVEPGTPIQLTYSVFTNRHGRKYFNFCEVVLLDENGNPAHQTTLDRPGVEIEE